VIQTIKASLLAAGFPATARKNLQKLQLKIG